MNNRQNGRRRGRGGQQVRNGQPGGQDRGNRIDNRARGNAAQLLEKYKGLARDAQMQGDRVNTEYYLQFADHYFRVLSESRSRFEEQRPQRPQADYRDEFGDDDGEDGSGEQGWNDDGPAERQVEPTRAERGEPPRGERAEPARAERAEPARNEQGETAARANDARDDTRGDEARRERRPRRAPRATAPVADAPQEGVRAMEGELAPARIEIDRLPQGFGPRGDEPTEDAAPAAEAAPRRRRAPRRPRDEASVEA